VVPEHEGQVGVGEGVSPEEELGDLGFGHVTIIRGVAGFSRAASGKGRLD
jgi:hypothetical protein